MGYSAHVENTQQGAGAGSDNAQPPGLKHKLAAQLKAWRTALSAPWDPVRAETLHAELEGLAEEAAEAGFLALGDATLALDVFLCSVVDKPTPPTPAQRTTLDSLL